MAVSDNLLRTSLLGELRLAPLAPSPGWHAVLFLLLLLFMTLSGFEQQSFPAKRKQDIAGDGQ